MLRGVAVIYREEAQRFIPVSFRLHGENTAKALAKIQKALRRCLRNRTGLSAMKAGNSMLTGMTLWFAIVSRPLAGQNWRQPSKKKTKNPTLTVSTSDFISGICGETCKREIILVTFLTVWEDYLRGFLQDCSAWNCVRETRN